MLAPRSPYGSRLWPGRTPIKAKFAEIVPQCYYKDAHSQSRNWADLWYDWNWPGWIKPQIDLALQYGANGIKFACSGGLPDGGPYPSFAVWTSRVRAVADYLRSKGALLYINLSSPSELWNADGSLTATATGTLPASLAFFDTLPSLVGIDLCNEVGYSAPSAWGNNCLSTIAQTGIAAVFAMARQNCRTIPLTMSCNVEAGNQWGAGVNNGLIGTAAFVDFHDVHNYYGRDGNSLVPNGTPAIADVAPMLNAPWFRGGWIHGESGNNQYEGGAARVAYLRAVGAVHQHPKSLGGVLFGMADYVTDSPQARYGVADELIAPRVDQLSAFRDSWPAAQ